MPKNVTLPIVLTALMVCAVHPARATNSKNYVYRAYEFKTDELLATELKNITEDDDGTVRVHHTFKGEEQEVEEVYLLDGGLGTQSWTIRDVKEALDYNGYRRGNTLHITGRLKDKPVDTELTVDELPLCNHPKVTLSKFALSGRDAGECWGLRKSTLDLYKMSFRKKAEETIVFHGQPVETVKVHFAPKNIIFEKFYQRTFYFRKSDGLFLKSDRHNGEGMELVTEDAGEMARRGDDADLK